VSIGDIKSYRFCWQMTTSTTAMTATNAAQATVAATISIALSTTLNALHVNTAVQYNGNLHSYLRNTSTVKTSLTCSVSRQLISFVNTRNEWIRDGRNATNMYCYTDHVVCGTIGKIWCSIHREKWRRDAHLPSSGREPVGGQTTEVCDAWPVQRQTYGYLPSRKVSPPLDRHQILQLGDRGTCV